MINRFLRKIGIDSSMALEEKYQKLVAAQKEGKIPADKIILSPLHSSLKECAEVVGLLVNDAEGEGKKGTFPIGK